MRAFYTSNIRLPLAAAAASLVVACAGGQQATRPDNAAGSASSSSGTSGASNEPQTPKLSARAMLRFDDANKFWDQTKKSAKPDYDMAARKYESALAEDDRLAEADYNLGVIAERRGRPDEAATHYKTALKKKPSFRQAADNLAVLAENHGDTQAAINMYAEVARRFDDDGPSRAHLALLLQKAGDDDHALEMAREALIRDPRSVPAQKAMMLAYFGKKEYSLAKLVALRLIKVDENDADTYYTLGLILMAEKQDEKARVQFQKAVGARADHLPAHVMLARVALKDEDYSGAQEHLSRVVAAQPQNADAHLNLGVAYKGLGKFDQALAEYDTAERLNSKLAPIYLNRGIILQRVKNQPEKALALYKKYVDLKGEVGLPPDSSVFGLMKEAEQTVKAVDDAARMEEEQKKLQAAQKQQQEQLKKDQASQPPKAASSDKPAEKAGSQSVQPVKGTPPPSHGTKSEKPVSNKDEPDDAPQ